MPSNAIQTSGDGKVRCRMINDEVPIHICESEQGAYECEGCNAPTRRCTKCGKTRGIADAERGLCEFCAKEAGIAPRTAVFEGTPDKALSNVLERVRYVASSSQAVESQILRNKQTETIPSAPSITKDPAALFQTLMEHAEERDGSWMIRAPAVILMRRFHLLRQEAADVLSALAKKQFLRGESPWDEVVLIKTEDVEAIRQKLDHPRAQYKDDAPQRRRRVVPQVRAATSPTPSKQVKPVCKPDPANVTAQADLLANLPSMRPIATYGEIYAHLVSRSNEVRGERLVGGAVPMLQIRFKLSAVQSTEALEWLVSQKHLQQKDGWRTIALVSKEVVTDEGPARQQSQTSHAVRSGGVHRSSTGNATTSHKAERSDAVKPVSQSAPSAISATSSAEGADSLDGALVELERTLPVLRKKRDDLAVHVAQLEVAYQTLKALQNQLAQAQQLADSSLSEAVHAAQSLLSFLRK